jgi:hypothetical protein
VNGINVSCGGVLSVVGGYCQLWEGTVSCGRVLSDCGRVLSVVEGCCQIVEVYCQLQILLNEQI